MVAGVSNNTIRRRSNRCRQREIQVSSKVIKSSSNMPSTQHTYLVLRGIVLQYKSNNEFQPHKSADCLYHDVQILSNVDNILNKGKIKWFSELGTNGMMKICCIKYGNSKQVQWFHNQMIDPHGIVSGMRTNIHHNTKERDTETDTQHSGWHHTTTIIIIIDICNHQTEDIINWVIKSRLEMQIGKLINNTYYDSQNETLWSPECLISDEAATIRRVWKDSVITMGWIWFLWSILDKVSTRCFEYDHPSYSHTHTIQYRPNDSYLVINLLPQILATRESATSWTNTHQLRGTENVRPFLNRRNDEKRSWISMIRKNTEINNESSVESANVDIITEKKWPLTPTNINIECILLGNVYWTVLLQNHISC